MTSCECKSKCDCALFSIIVSAIIGVITVFLTYSATITVTPVFLWVVFGIAVAFLLVALLTAPRIKNSEYGSCLCTAVDEFLIGILATVLLALILLAIEFVATSLVGAIITGLLLAAFSLTLTSVVCIIKAVLKCKND